MQPTPHDYSEHQKLTNKFRNPNFAKEVKEVERGIETIQNLHLAWSGLSCLVTVLVCASIISAGALQPITNTTPESILCILIGLSCITLGVFNTSYILLGALLFYRRERILLLRKKTQFKNKQNALAYLEEKDPAAAEIIKKIRDVKLRAQDN